MFSCINCSWEGEEAKGNRFCPVCGDNVKSLNTVTSKIEPTFVPEQEKGTEEKSFIENVRDIAEDLLDDGKLNNSNKKGKRGRKK